MINEVLVLRPAMVNLKELIVKVKNPVLLLTLGLLLFLGVACTGTPVEPTPMLSVTGPPQQGREISTQVPESEHWFAESDRPEYNRAAAELAWERTLRFLRKVLS
jgi:hypothetical protein